MRVSRARWEVVLFDLDGTVVNTIPLILASYAHATTQVLGQAAPENESRGWIGRSLADTLEENYPVHHQELMDAYLSWNRVNLERMVERFEGIHEPTGEGIRPKRVWGKNANWEGHRFSDEEVEKLLAGEKISFPAVSKAGNDYTAQGYLGRGEYNGNPYWGFQLDFSGVPESFLGHKFTAQEKADIESGKRVRVEGLVGKKGTPFDAWVSYGEKDGETEKSMILDFSD
mgnify:CR=1 FL=1